MRLPYAVFYDVEGGSITALRAYFPITALVQTLPEAAARGYRTVIVLVAEEAFVVAVAL